MIYFSCCNLDLMIYNSEQRQQRHVLLICNTRRAELCRCPGLLLKLILAKKFWHQPS
jgi:hypothetical protein